MAGEPGWVLGVGVGRSGVESASGLSQGQGTGVTLGELPGLSAKGDTDPDLGGALVEELVRESARVLAYCPSSQYSFPEYELPPTFLPGGEQ